MMTGPSGVKPIWYQLMKGEPGLVPSTEASTQRLWLAARSIQTSGACISEQPGPALGEAQRASARLLWGRYREQANIRR